MRLWLFQLVLLLLAGISCYGQGQVKLKEVVVRPYLKKEVLGTQQKKADYGHGGNRDFPHYQTAYLIPTKNLKGFVDRVGVYIYHKHSFLEFAKKANKLKLYLYAAGPDGAPGQLILPEPITIRPKKNTYWHWVDVSKYNIALPEEGIFAAVSWPQATKKDTGPYVGMTNECDTCPFYISRFMTDKPGWVKIQQHEKSRGFGQNLMVRLEVSVK